MADVPERGLLFDTDVFVDHLRGARRMPQTAGSYSVITRAELFAGAEGQEPAVRDLLALHTELSVDSAVAERAGRIKRAIDIRMPDALVAATALEHDLELVTRNRKDFERIRALHVRAPGAR